LHASKKIRKRCFVFGTGRNFAVIIKATLWQETEILQVAHLIKNSGQMNPSEMKKSEQDLIHINNILNKNKISSINAFSTKKSQDVVTI
jgi:hypothetical protein